ncbi:aldo/keto reductase [Nocardia amikacinitolerans]|uniref:aldo/keto reductase n=1 Tax=Nocardia amikacinitolerans TaxID=756689 RepID=UPI00367B61FB
MPQLGFSVFRVPDADATPAVAAALGAGFRAIDTAAYYKNEAGVGAAIAASDLPREQLHITTKARHTDLGYDSTLAALDDSLASSIGVSNGSSPKRAPRRRSTRSSCTPPRTDRAARSSAATNTRQRRPRREESRRGLPRIRTVHEPVGPPTALLRRRTAATSICHW